MKLSGLFLESGLLGRFSHVRGGGACREARGRLLIAAIVSFMMLLYLYLYGETLGPVHKQSQLNYNELLESS